ncbi:MAG TPA: hypothetical protein VIM26_15480 [Pengzhenrongella sp.]
MRFFRRRPGPDSPHVARVPLTFAEALASASDRDVEVRAAAGVLLASATDLDQVADILIRLLLDQEDTFVTSETADALVDRRDVPGLRLVILALARADDENTANWIWDALLDPQTYEELAERTSLLEALTGSDVAATARTVLERLRA